MATLTVRKLTPRDLLALRDVRQRRERADDPSDRIVRGPDTGMIVASGAPNRLSKARGFVALIDEEICGYLVVSQHDSSYRCDVVALGAGSPRLEASDGVSVELWVALLEYAIKDVGTLGVRRLFASAADGTTLFDSLTQAGFSPYTKLYCMCGPLAGLPDQTPSGFREQHVSDVWSIHQLYHRSTPPAVQFSEAFTSDEWEPPERTWRDRLALRAHSRHAYVLAGQNEDIGGYCRMLRRGKNVMISFLMQPDCAGTSVDMVSAAATAAGVADDDRIQLMIPAYVQEAVSHFEAHGFVVERELVSMVRYTTAPMIVHPELAPVSAAVESRRPARGALSGARRPM